MKKSLIVFMFLVVSVNIFAEGIATTQRSIISPSAMIAVENFEIGAYSQHSLTSFLSSPKLGLIDAVISLPSRFYIHFQPRYSSMNITQNFAFVSNVGYKVFENKTVKFGLSVGLGVKIETINYSSLGDIADPLLIEKVNRYKANTQILLSSGIYVQIPYMYASLYSNDLRKELSFFAGFTTVPKKDDNYYDKPKSKIIFELNSQTQFIYREKKISQEFQAWIKAKGFGFGFGYGLPNLYRAMAYIGISTLRIGYGFSISKFDFLRSSHAISIHYTLPVKSDKLYY